VLIFNQIDNLDLWSIFLSGQNPNNFMNYGCWCSNKDRTTHAPLDEIDECCQTHQNCDIERTGSAAYPYKTSFEDGTIECLNNAETKAHRQCKCDHELARCLHKHQDVYTDNLLFVSDAKCSPGIVLNFDDLLTNTTFKNMPENYHNFTFTGAHYSDGKSSQSPSSRPNGYQLAMVSPPNVLFGQNQITVKRVDGQPFSIVSFSAASVYIQNLKLTIIGTRQYSPVVFNETLLLPYDKRTNVELNWAGIDTLAINATGGKVSHTGTCGDCHFAIDDMRFRL